MRSIQLLGPDGALQSYMLRGIPLAVTRPAGAFNRVVFSAAHVVADARAASNPSGAAAIDWDATLAYRRHLAELGLGIAESMDTAQRGMGLGWSEALELIRRTHDALRDTKVPVFNGCGTDHLATGSARSLEDVVAAYHQQMDAIQGAGARLIVMASRELARIARTPDDYLTVYRKLLARADHPVILHWLGDMFDPQLAGYWGKDDLTAARDVALRVIEDNVQHVDGIKISLLDKQREIDMRRLMPATVKMYTGDDFNYPELIRGDDHGYSHALLGIFDAIAPAASLAMGLLAQGKLGEFHALLAPTVPLSHLIFRAPTQYYKTGVVFMAYLNGHQQHMVMVAGHQAMRPLPYFCDIFKLADAAGLLRDPDLAIDRMRGFLAFYGVEG